MAEWSEPYVHRGGKDLLMHVFAPASPAAPAAAVLFFHGGGWRNGTPAQFTPWARQLAERRVLACSAAYRLIGHDADDVRDCVADAHAAYRWLQESASRLSVDPRRCAVGGGSAGGHLALIVTADLLDTPPQPPPAGCLLFNPVVDTGLERFSKTFGGFPTLNPMRRAGGGFPPVTVFHGMADELVPVAAVETFAAALRQAGGTVDLFTYADQPHGFFNPQNAPPAVLADIRRGVDAFADRLLG